MGDYSISRRSYWRLTNAGHGPTLQPSQATQQNSPNKRKNSSKPHASSTAGGSPRSSSATTSPPSSVSCAWASAGHSTRSRRFAKQTIVLWREGRGTRCLWSLIVFIGGMRRRVRLMSCGLGRFGRCFLRGRIRRMSPHGSLRWRRRRRRRWSRIVSIGRSASAYCRVLSVYRRICLCAY